LPCQYALRPMKRVVVMGSCEYKTFETNLKKSTK
jgi:hypothetical protein